MTRYEPRVGTGPNRRFETRHVRFGQTLVTWEADEMIDPSPFCYSGGPIRTPVVYDQPLHRLHPSYLTG